ncbi:MAG: protein kinase [Pirellulales bacterium]|nr:protein kinase [Pirellulales bacterium]
MPALINKTAELVAGYSLQERIGSGGYGEVWRAEAPGGLLKAVKFIYGRFDEERASCELKALHRIKEVRHPFLLSLERIEVIDGQLVIVTELAEASLHDRFEACKAQGLPGIPRDELLRYLHDAADALDYMCEHFLLQHLDIKPENLLIVGGRVKVADFGLVKDVQDVTCSLMGGMTPIYAAPEVFDAHPSLHSDQYSLAIVYQEMLSGILPFPGKTVAQLTSQHLHGHPRLTPVPPGDRPILARAMDKDPQKRFDTCRGLIEALQGAMDVEFAPAAPRTDRVPAREIIPTITLSNAEPNCDTEAQSRRNAVWQSSAESAPAPCEKSSLGEEAPFSDAVCEGLDTSVREKLGAIDSAERDRVTPLPLELPPLEFENLSAWEQPFTEVHLRPTLVIGAGGTAARVLRQLQHRWEARFGDLEEIPIFQALLIDTDPQTLGQTTSTDSARRRIQSELLPLRKSEDYRERADGLMRWLGHRWIYNIPRSLHTEGLRPLGRLALIDNARQANARIRKMLKNIVSPAAVEAAAQRTKLPVSETAPLIYLVASISGGTGGGMILDLAYAVRQALSQEGIASARICGILLHGTSRHAAEKKLAVANSYACLAELQAYRRSYPGEAAWGMPAEEGRPPFDDTYFVHLGDDLGDSQFDAATEKIAEYLALDTSTACRDFFARCRTSPASSEMPASAEGTLRSMGLSRIGFTADDIPAADLETLCGSLADQWRQMPRELAPRTLAPGILPSVSLARSAALAANFEAARSGAAGNAHLDFDALSERVDAVVHEQVHSSNECALRETLEKTYQLANPAADLDNPADRAEKTLDALFATVRSFVENGVDSTAAADEPVLLQLRRLAAEEGVALRKRILRQLESAESGLPGMQKTIDDLLLELLRRERDACKRQDRLREILAQAEVLLVSSPDAETKSWFRRLFTREKRTPLASCWSDYARWRLELVVLHGRRYLWHSLHAGLTVLNEQLREMRQEMQAVFQEFQRAEPQAESPDGDRGGAFQRLLNGAWAELLRKNQRALTGKLERRVLRTILADIFGAEENAPTRAHTVKEWAELLRKSVRFELGDLLREIDLAGLFPSSDAMEPNGSSPLKAILERAQSPQHSCYGGAQRLLLACPSGAALETVKQKIEAAMQAAPSIARTSSPEVFFCFEVERVPPLRIAAQLLENQEDCRAIAAKLRARIDVSWPRGF